MAASAGITLMLVPSAQSAPSEMRPAVAQPERPAQRVTVAVPKVHLPLVDNFAGPKQPVTSCAGTINILIAALDSRSCS